MSNEIGNNLFEGFTKKLIAELKKNRNTNIPEVIDGYIQNFNETKLFNLTDVMFNVSRKEVYKVVNFNYDESNKILRAPVEYAPYIDSLFSYIKIANDNYVCLYLWRLSESRVIGYMYTFSLSGVEGLFSLPIEIDFAGVTVHLSPYIESFGSVSSNESLVQSVKMFMELIFSTFKALQDQEGPKYACYIDEPTKPRSIYLRRDNKTPAWKIAEKPIILVLRDTPQRDKVAQKYRRKNGNIQYAFSWVVRGHYRKLHNPATVGKDRNGDKTIQGYTWVETYMKGDGPVLKREHVVLDKRKGYKYA